MAVSGARIGIRLALPIVLSVPIAQIQAHHLIIFIAFNEAINSVCGLLVSLAIVRMVSDREGSHSRSDCDFDSLFNSHVYHFLSFICLYYSR